MCVSKSVVGHICFNLEGKKDESLYIKKAKGPWPFAGPNALGSIDPKHHADPGPYKMENNVAGVKPEKLFFCWTFFSINSFILSL